jgi:DNA-binding GntR family transcriptional regulator
VLIRNVYDVADEIDRWNPEPVYLQLAAILRGQIERGELVPRQPLPSESYLVGHYGVSRGTARRAIEVLRDEGRVVTIPQRGTYVSER